MNEDEKRNLFGQWPDRPTTVPIVRFNRNDNEVKRVMVEQQMSHILERRHGITGPMRYQSYWGDEKLFYMVSRYVDYPNPEDNGYSLYTIDRRTCSIDDAVKMFRAIAMSGASGPVEIDQIERLNLPYQ